MIKRSLHFIFVFIFALIFFGPNVKPIQAQEMTLPYGFVEDVIVDGLWLPTSFAIAPDGRIFIAEKAGVVRVWHNGSMVPEPFIDMQSEVNSNLDRGMLSVAVHPQFPAQPYVYVGYVYDPPEVEGIEPSGARVARVKRIAAAPSNLNRAADRGEVILGKNSTFGTIGNPYEGETRPFSCMGAGDAPLNDCLPIEGVHHTIGGMVFGRDGALYVANGDGINSIFGNIRAQNIDSLAGKILRIDPITGEGLSSNPFYNGDPNSNRSKVYLLGMRNPFRFSIHPQTGDLYVGDVGNDNWEEINVGRAGDNFGWPCFEGYDQITTNPACDPLLSGAVRHVTGIYTYPHINSQGSVIGGDFYRGRTFPPRYHNRFFFGEFNEGSIMFLDPPDNGLSPSRRFAGNIEGPVQIASAPDGNMYVLHIKPGRLSRIRFAMQEYGSREAGNPPSPVTIAPNAGEFAPVAALPPAPAPQPQVQPPAAAPTVAALPTPAPVDLPAPQPAVSQPAVAQPAVAQPAVEQSTVAPVLTDAITSVQVQPAKESDPNSPIYVRILAPADSTVVRLGDTVNYRGWATDGNGAVIQGEDLSWTVLLHHNEHTHYDFYNGRGTEGSFTFRDHGDRIYLELCLTATAGDESNTECVNVRAQEVAYTFDTQPSGLRLIYNGGLYRTPFRVVTYANALRNISAPRAPRAGYSFVTWSNSEPVSQTLRIGDINQTLSAVYAVPRSEPTTVPVSAPISAPVSPPIAQPTTQISAPPAAPQTATVITQSPATLPETAPEVAPEVAPEIAPEIAPEADALSLAPVTSPSQTQPQDPQSSLSYPADAFRVIHPGPTHTDSGRAYFNWETLVLPPEGQAFEIVFWKPGQDPVADGFGLNAPTTESDLRIDLEKLDKALGDLLLPGTYNWTVLLVNQSPYERLQIVSDTRQFTFERK